MAATPSTVTRTDDVTGDAFQTYENAAGNVVQAMALSPEVQGELLTWTNTAGTAATSLVASANPVRIFRAEVCLEPQMMSPRYLQLHNAIATPSNGAVPEFRAFVAAGQSAVIDLGVFGYLFSTGCTAVLSLSPGTLTLPASSEGYFSLGFVE